MKTDGIIFDLDGTIWDSTETVVASNNEILAKEGYSDKHITVDMMKSVMGLLNEDIAKIFYPDLPHEERMALMDRCCQHENEYVGEHGGILYPEVEVTLQALAQRYPLYIVSNCQDGYIEAMFRAHGLQYLFQDHECSGRTGLPKWENIRKIVERNQLQAPVYIGDTSTDAASAKKAGVPFVFASYGFGEVQEYDARIAAFEDLKTIFL